MQRFALRDFWCFAALVALVAFPCGSAEINGQTSDAPAQSQNPPPFRLEATANLVVVRVAVRDAQGKPVENLKKEDFKLFDRGKKQTIAQFDVETSKAASGSSGAFAAATQPTSSPTPGSPDTPANYTLFYFDDLDSSAPDLIEARDAADSYVSTRLRTQDRVAIVTSEEMLVNFTSDVKAIHEALLKLHASSHALSVAQNCPDLSDYQAEQITQNNQEALSVANDEARHCEGGVLQAPAGAPGASSSRNGGSSGGGAGRAHATSAGGSGIADFVIRKMAQTIVNQVDAQARTTFQQLTHAVDYIAQKNGRRTVILVSPGFLSQRAQLQLDSLINRALRSQVVISALDPKGLAVLIREFDTSRQYVPATNGAMMSAAHRLDSDRELVATAVLADVAEGTGGEYFHNRNDLKAGFGALTGSPVSYILAFSPSDLKTDGKFHNLKVTLSRKQKGFTIQARRGYFASTSQTAIAPETALEAPSSVNGTETTKTNPKDVAGANVAVPTATALVDSEAQTQKDIREAVLSKSDLQQLPVVMDVKAESGNGQVRQLSIFAHLDTALLHFRKDEDQNLSTVTFVFAVFDQQDKLINAQRRRAQVKVSDAQMASLMKSGLDVNATFQLSPGTYRIREVVTDSEDHRMTSASRLVEVQKPEDEPAQAQAQPQPPTQTQAQHAVDDSLADEEKKLYASAHPYIDDSLPVLKKTLHELNGLKPAQDQGQLKDILAKTGAKADELLHEVPDVISDERVSEMQWTEMEVVPMGCTGLDCSDFVRYGGQEHKFNYIILAHAQNDQHQLFEEYRANQNGKPIGKGENAPHFQGFASSWVVFSSPNQQESRFRELGEQKMDGHNTFVIGFAQAPGEVGYPGRFMDAQGNSAPMLLQGIAWVDSSDFRIVRLRTDLLAPLLEIGFKKQTSNIQLGPVRITDHEGELWLPKAVDVEMQAQKQFLREQHQYSNYRLYQAKTKIIVSPN